MAAVLPFPAIHSRADAPVSALDGRCVAALFATRGEGQVSAMGTLLVFPAVASREQRIEEGFVEVQAQQQRAERKTSEAHGLLMEALTEIVATSWNGPVSTSAVGKLIVSERLLGHDAIPAQRLARQAAHELAALASAIKCEACDQAAKERRPAHGRAV